VFNNPLSLVDPLGLCVVNTVGRWLGTGYGEEAAMWYAERYNETGAWYYMAGGLLASLWTPETYVQTAITLATAPLVAAKIAAAGVQSAAAAARVAVKEVIEEVIGVPIPGKGKSFASKRGVKNADDVIHVTPDGVALPKGAKHQIPDHYVENPHGRPGSYGEKVDGKFQEKIRIDTATPPGKKGPNYSHYHKDGKRPHYSPRPGDKDPGF